MNLKNLFRTQHKPSSAESAERLSNTTFIISAVSIPKGFASDWNGLESKSLDEAPLYPFSDHNSPDLYLGILGIGAATECRGERYV